MSDPESKLRLLVENYKSRFQCVFYNLKEANKYYIQPAGIDDSDNPDPDRLVPVLADGFKDLLARVKVQATALAKAKKSIEDLDIIVTDLEGKQLELHHTDFENCCSKQANLAHRLLNVMKKLELLRSLQTPFTSEESAFQHRMQSLFAEVESCKPKCLEFFTNLNLAKIRAPEALPQLEASCVEQIFELLSYQTDKVEYLTKSVAGDLEVAEVSNNLLDKM